MNRCQNTFRIKLWKTTCIKECQLYLCRLNISHNRIPHINFLSSIDSMMISVACSTYASKGLASTKHCRTKQLKLGRWAICNPVLEIILSAFMLPVGQIINAFENYHSSFVPIAHSRDDLCNAGVLTYVLAWVPLSLIFDVQAQRGCGKHKPTLISFKWNEHQAQQRGNIPRNAPTATHKNVCYHVLFNSQSSAAISSHIPT